MSVFLSRYENDAAFHSRQSRISNPMADDAKNAKCRLVSANAEGNMYIWEGLTEGNVYVSAQGRSCEEARKKYCLLYGLYVPEGCPESDHPTANVAGIKSSVAQRAKAFAAGAGTGGSGSGCSTTATAGGGNSPGWYTAGANSSSGAGWGGSSGHHHCDWQSPCCFCTDPPKCISSGTPPQAPGSCRPDWGTKSYLGGGNYPSTADFSKCPAGTAGSGDGTGGGGGGGGGDSSTQILQTIKQNWLIVVGALLLLIVLMRR